MIKIPLDELESYSADELSVSACVCETVFAAHAQRWIWADAQSFTRPITSQMSRIWRLGDDLYLVPRRERYAIKCRTISEAQAIHALMGYP